MDTFTKKRRSEIMAKVKSKNSKAEIMVFSYLQKNKVYFQRHYKRAIGTPDIALPRKKKAVFIDGDYWHGRYMDKVTKDEFWIKKIKGNKLRDKNVTKQLVSGGWVILRVWESDINRKKTQEVSLRKIRDFLLS